MRVIFMGTPEFAAVSLRALYDSDHEVIAVFTQPDKPIGRGHKMDASPVKKLAIEHKTAVFQPGSLKNGETLDLIQELEPDILAVVAYGKMIPRSIFSSPKYGAINLHGSLLPKYRGASPIQSSVLNGDDITGVCTMHIAEDMDTGDIIYCEETEIGEYETSGELTVRLSEIGAKLLIRTLTEIEKGTAPRLPQDNSKASYTGRLNKSMSPVDWNKSQKEIIKQICGLDPWPAASAAFGDSHLKLYAPQYTQTTTNKNPGEIVYAGKEGIEIACAKGKTVLITEVQAAGKKRLKASEWLLGHPLQVL